MSKTEKTRAPTIMDVARVANVSKSTVSLVLLSSPLIKEETAKRVREAARELGYVYNRRAAELRQQSSNTVGVIINDLMNPFFAEVLIGIERKLVDAGYIVFMAHTNEDLTRQSKVLASMREQNAAGILLCPALDTPRSLAKEVKSWGIPLVVMVRSLGPGSYDFAGSDNELGVELATNHLIKAGHKRIGFIGGRTGVVYEQRLRGYRKALEAAHLGVSDAHIVQSAPNRTGGYEAMSAMLKLKSKPTAAVCYNDITAFGALSALGENGLRAGVDFGLIGFDNVLAAEHSNPPLSTIDIHPSEIGENAATKLMTRIANPGIKRQIYLAEPKLLLRHTD